MQPIVVFSPPSKTAQTEERDSSCNKRSIYLQKTLNKALLTGPGLLCSLVGLLLRFRQFAIAVTEDKESMFMQIAVRKEDQDALRFVWYKNNTETIYKYKQLIFGATCSPSCAIYVLRKYATDYRHVSLKPVDQY